MLRAAIVAVATLSSIAYVVLGGVAMTTSLATPNAMAWLLLSAPPMVAAAAVLMWRRPDNPIGGLLMLTALGTVVLPTVLEIPTLVRFQVAGPESWMWAPIWLAQTLGTLGVTAAAFMLAVLPDGRVRDRHERWIVPAGLVAAALPTASLISNELVPTQTFQFPGVSGISSPIYVQALGALGPVVALASALGNLLIVVGLGALLFRYRRTSQRERRQLRWVLLAGLVAIVSGIVPAALAETGALPELGHGLAAMATFLPSLLLPLSVVAAVLEPAWIDVDIVIRRSFVYGTLSLGILAIYVAAALIVGVAAGSELSIELAILLTVIVALALQPVRKRLQRWADSWVFGAPPTRYGALAEFGSGVGEVVDPFQLPQLLAATAHQALRLSWATASLEDIGSHSVGRREGYAAAVLDVRHGGLVYGHLECGTPVDGDLGPADLGLLRALAGQAGLAIANARLAARIVEAQEEERRRIERNLHDGAQQSLVALIARLGLMRSRIEAGTADPDAVDELQAAARTILTDIRELAQGIHPSIVTDGGVLAAVEERCSSLPIEVTLQASPDLRRARMPAQIEAAAYFLVAEALANILKHAGSAKATVTLLRHDGRLSVAVADDGAGFDPGSTERRGLAGLEDRFAALGGSMHVASRPGAGTRISASLPVEP